MYVLESDGIIRKITPSGYVSTFFTQNMFKTPQGIAVDNNFNVYVADTYNDRIIKITPDSSASTFAGGNGAGFLDGAGTIAKFRSPNGIDVDKDGNVFVADEDNLRIRKITPDGFVSTIARIGIVDPSDVTIDLDGNIYVCQRAFGSLHVKKIDTLGVVTHIAGTNHSEGDLDGPGSTARFARLEGIAIDTNNTIYVLDQGNRKVKKIELSTITNVNKPLSSSGINIFPNPSQNVLNINLQDITQGSISIFDMKGNKVLTQKINNNQNVIDLKTILSGSYVIHIINEQTTYTRQLIISK